MRKPIEMVTAVAVMHPEITMGDYFRDYEPAKPQNTICAKCRRCGTGTCEWDNKLSAVPDWIADVECEPDKPGKIESALIYYCPKFESEEELGRLMPYDEAESFKLLLAIAEQNGVGYRMLLRKYKDLRDGLKELDERSSLWAKYATQYYQMMFEKRQYEDLLESHYKSMQLKLGYEDDPEFDAKVVRAIAKRGKGKTYDE